jgi:zinc transport system ATP-binding protein
MRAKISTEGLSVIMGSQAILENIDIEIPEGKLTAIIGPNGAGKTTLIKCILRLAKYEGRILIDGKPVEEVDIRRIGYVPQRMELDRGLPLEVLEFLALGGGPKSILFGIRGERKEYLLALLSRVRGDHLAHKRVSGLSGGELQRILLAKALCSDPSILILDEPASGVDISGEELFCDLLEDIQKETGKTVILVSHDLSVVTHHADFVICLDKTVKCTGPPLEVMKTDNLYDLFGEHSGFFIHGEGHKSPHRPPS